MGYIVQNQYVVLSQAKKKPTGKCKYYIYYTIYDHFGPELESKPLPRGHEIFSFGRGPT